MTNLVISWSPTFSCNLICSYCAARQYPARTHGNTLPAERWLELFQSCPATIDLVAISGREPSCYRGLAEVLQGTQFRFSIDTNLRNDPSAFVSDIDPIRLHAFNCGLHFHPDHPEAAIYWKHLEWLRDHTPDTCRVSCQFVTLWRDEATVLDRVRERCAEAKISLDILTFDDTFLYSEKQPLQSGSVASCNGGKNFVVMFPDSSIYRCYGHAYSKIDCLGKLSEAGWQILHRDPQPCGELYCTMCDYTIRSKVVPCQP